VNPSKQRISKDKITEKMRAGREVTLLPFCEPIGLKIHNSLFYYIIDIIDIL
jgi:hypothetical protein